MSDLRQALIFTAAVLLTSWSLEGFIILKGGVRSFGPLWLVALMCIPGILSILLRVILNSGFADAGFRIGRSRYYVYAIGVPALLASAMGLVSAAVDIRQFSPVPPEEVSPLVPILLSVLGLGLIGALGEELGWRGFLLPKLVSSGIAHPYLVCGLIWAAWHLPLIALGGFYQTDNILLMTSVYGIGIVAMSFFISELRMRSGSVWVAAIVHAAHNFFFQFALPALVLTAAGSRSELWDTVAGDTGLIIAVLYGLSYLVFRRAASKPRTP